MRDRMRRAVVSGHNRMAQLILRDRPLPLAYWRTMRKIAGSIAPSPDPLLPPLHSRSLAPSAFRAAELRDIFADGLLNAWTLDVDTIDVIWEMLADDTPMTIIECGAGVSTMLFASYAAASNRNARPFVVSIEQDRDYRSVVENRLATLGLEQFATIIHTPVGNDGRYMFDRGAIEQALNGRRADWIMIDGPSGPEGARDNTLPSLAPFCSSGARWFLDDAFRDGEMKILAEWASLPGVMAEGIMPVGKGLAAGRVADPAKVVAA